MKIREAIDRIDSLKHNTYTNGEKIDWLNRLDAMIKQQIIDTHEGYEEVIYRPYTEKDMEKDLILTAPYDDVYIRWLEAQIDYYNGEINRYNNSITMFRTAYDTFANYYNRMHMPLGVKNKYFGGSSTRRTYGQSVVDIVIKEV